MPTGTISSQFDITLLCTPAESAAGLTFTAIRAFTVVGISYTNTGGATTLNCTNAGAQFTAPVTDVPGLAVVTAAATTGGSNNARVLAANASVAEGAVVFVQAGAAQLNKVVLHCIGNPSQAITVV